MNALLSLLLLGASGPEVLSHALDAERAAKQQVGEGRLARSEERGRVTEDLQQMYRRLGEARARVAKLQGVVDEARKQAVQAKRDVGTFAARRRRLESALSEAAVIDISNVKHADAVRHGIQTRLQSLKDHSSVQITEGLVTDRSGVQTRAELVRLGAHTAVALTNDEQSTGLALRADQGVYQVGGPRLSEAQIRSLRGLKAGMASVIPLDVDGSLVGVLEAAPASWLSKGGAFVWPILAVGLLGFLLLLERVWYLGRRHRGRRQLPTIQRLLDSGDLAAIRRLISKQTDFGRVILRGLDVQSSRAEDREVALEGALLSEEPRLERSLTLLAASAGVAPLLGLLGTVTGMIQTFQTITAHGTGNPELLSAGISVALITTQLGLLVAVPLLLGHAWASRAVERRQALLEETRTIVLAAGAPRP